MARSQYQDERGKNEKNKKPQRAGQTKTLQCKVSNQTGQGLQMRTHIRMSKAQSTTVDYGCTWPEDKKKRGVKSIWSNGWKRKDEDREEGDRSVPASMQVKSVASWRMVLSSVLLVQSLKRIKIKGNYRQQKQHLWKPLGSGKHQRPAHKVRKRKKKKIRRCQHKYEEATSQQRRVTRASQ